MIKIHGIIGNRPSETSLLQVVEQVKAQEGEAIEVEINSPGGDLDTGIQIYHYLRSLPCAVVTRCTGACASAASIVFLAGSRRIAGCPILIHNPYVEQVAGDAARLQQISQWIKEKEVQAECIYALHTGLNSETLSMLMETETYLSPAQAVELGFATEALPIALARYSPSTDLLTQKIDPKMKKNLIASLLQKKEKTGSEYLPADAFVSAFKTADGNCIFVARQQGEPQKGDPAMPNGEWKMPEGHTITVKDCKIVRIAPASPDEGFDNATEGQTIENLAARLRTLSLENGSLKKKIKSLETLVKTPQETQLLEAIALAGGTQAALEALDSNYRPAASAQHFNDTNDKPLSGIAEKLNRELEKRGILQ